MEGLLAAAEEKVKQIPNFDLAQKIYQYEIASSSTDSSDVSSCSTLKDEILKVIEDDSMDSLYVSLCSKLGWDIDQDKIDSMTVTNNSITADIETKRLDAIENFGDTEILDQMFAKARHYSLIGNWDAAVKAYDEIINKDKVGTAKKIDATMEKTRIALFTMDMAKLKELIAESKRLIDAGGDWDRRNRLKAYEALYLISIRDIKQGAKLFLECVATFTSVELCSYKQFIFYALVTNIMSLSRAEMKKNVANNPHIVSVIRDLPNVQGLFNSIYNCEYKMFLQSLLAVLPEISVDRYIGPHSSYIIRELRVLAYSQFLDAYKSVMMKSMASSFGLDANFLDQELSRFIASGRLNAKIDKVSDVIETSRPDKKNAQYQDVIKKGDSLLNDIQKLVRIIDV